MFDRNFPGSVPVKTGTSPGAIHIRPFRVNGDGYRKFFIQAVPVSIVFLLSLEN